MKPSDDFKKEQEKVELVRKLYEKNKQEIDKDIARVTKKHLNDKAHFNPKLKKEQRH